MCGWLWMGKSRQTTEVQQTTKKKNEFKKILYYGYRRELE